MITYLTNPSLTVDRILPLYEAVGWTSYSQHPAMLAAALEGSRDVLAAYDGDKLVGLVRTVGDGASIIFVQDLLVLPSYQRRGIGRHLLTLIIEQYPQIHQLHLLTGQEEQTMAFYQSLGFVDVTSLDCVAYTYRK